jgi:hypothetical protein
LRSPLINIPIVLIYQKRKNESKITKIANKEGDSRTKKRLQKKRENNEMRCDFLSFLFFLSLK